MKWQTKEKFKNMESESKIKCSHYPFNYENAKRRQNMSEEEQAVDDYINGSINKIPDNRKELVREKMLKSRWIPYEEQKPPSEKRILEKTQNGSVGVVWFNGIQRWDGILKITHWKPLLK